MLPLGFKDPADAERFARLWYERGDELREMELDEVIQAMRDAGIDVPNEMVEQAEKAMADMLESAGSVEAEGDEEGGDE